MQQTENGWNCCLMAAPDGSKAGGWIGWWIQRVACQLAVKNCLWPRKRKYPEANLATKVIKCAHARLNKFNLHEFVKASRRLTSSGGEDTSHKLPYKTDKNLCSQKFCRCEQQDKHCQRQQLDAWAGTATAGAGSGSASARASGMSYAVS